MEDSLRKKVNTYVHPDVLIGTVTPPSPPPPSYFSFESQLPSGDQESPQAEGSKSADFFLVN